MHAPAPWEQGSNHNLLPLLPFLTTETATITTAATSQQASLPIQITAFGPQNTPSTQPSLAPTSGSNPQPPNLSTYSAPPSGTSPLFRHNPLSSLGPLAILTTIPVIASSVSTTVPRVDVAGGKRKPTTEDVGEIGNWGKDSGQGMGHVEKKVKMGNEGFKFGLESVIGACGDVDGGEKEEEEEVDLYEDFCWWACSLQKHANQFIGNIELFEAKLSLCK